MKPTFTHWPADGQRSTRLRAWRDDLRARRAAHRVVLRKRKNPRLETFIVLGADYFERLVQIQIGGHLDGDGHLTVVAAEAVGRGEALVVPSLDIGEPLPPPLEWPWWMPRAESRGYATATTGDDDRKGD